MTKFLNISTDNTLGGNSPSDDVVSSQKAIKTALNAKANSADLATVATSGSYNDLINKPNKLVAGTDLEIINNVLPEGYTQLTYLEGDGSTTYINTGIAGNTLVSPKIVAKFQMLGSGDWDYFGQSSNSNGAIIYDYAQPDSQYIRWGTTGYNRFNGDTRKLDFRNSFHVLEMGGNDIKLENPVLVDGTQIGVLTADSSAAIGNTGPILIFRSRTNAGISRFAYFTIYSNGEQVFNGIPAKRNSDNVLGMYDTVSNTFKTNAGTGTFTAGNEVNGDLIYFTNQSGYALKTYVDSGLATKQATLVSGTNIKTINNQSILGSGNIDTSESGGGYHPNLLSWEWDDHLRNSVQWLRGDTFSWQSGSVYQVAYQHLVNDISGKTLQTETVNGTTISFYLADDGHKICPSTQEQNVLNVFNSTGVAWYYILDTTNQRFKLPRDNSQSQRVLIKTITSGTKWARVYSDGWVEQGGTDGTSNTTINLLVTMANTDYVVTCGFAISNNGAQIVTKYTDRFVTSFSTNYSWTSGGWLVVGYADTTYLANVASQFDAQYKYLYFYVGNFTQTALENTAGLNAELFNDKADRTLNNVSAGIDFVVETQTPSAGNNYTWYRKYKSGWVEQGGQIQNAFSGTVSFPVEMADTNYAITVTVITSRAASSFDRELCPNTLATDGFTITNVGGSGSNGARWEVKGMAQG